MPGLLVEIDASSRIYSKTERGNDTSIKESRFKELTQEAKEAFEKAISLDKRYILSHINLACLYDIRGNYQAALGVVNELESLITAINYDLQLVKAIAMYHIKNKGESERILQSIAVSGNEVYEYNYNLLKNSIVSGNDVQAIERWKDYWVKEKVVLLSDTCNSRYRRLSNIANNKSTALPQNISESLSLSRIVIAGTPLLIVKSKNKKIIAELSIYKSPDSASHPEFKKFTANNGKCFSIQLPGSTWSVVYKEFRDD